MTNEPSPVYRQLATAASLVENRDLLRDVLGDRYEATVEPLRAEIRAALRADPTANLMAFAADVAADNRRGALATNTAATILAACIDIAEEMATMRDEVLRQAAAAAHLPLAMDMPDQATPYDYAVGRAQAAAFHAATKGNPAP